MAFASKIALATILLGFLFVGGASLQAQEGSENGWFVSASPLIFGASKIETKTTITASGGGEVTVGDLTADIRTNVNQMTYDNRYTKYSKNLCAGTLTGDNLTVALEIFYLAEDRSDATDLTLRLAESFGSYSFSAQRRRTSIHRRWNDIATSNVNLSPIADSACKDAFDGLLLQDLSATALMALAKPALEKPSRATASRWATETATTDIL